MRAKALIDDGNLVPDEIINEMVLSRIQHEDCSIGFLLDGYPRTIAQAETLAGAVNIDAVIDINVDSDILIERVSSRRVCPKCNHSQCVSAADTAAGKPELCAKCGAELIRRPDDNPESMPAPGSKSTTTEPSRLSTSIAKKVFSFPSTAQ